jgi:hypothetical protein
MVDPARRARLLRELEQEFIPDYDANSMPSADKRAAYALEHIAFRVGRLEQLLSRLVAAIEAALPKARPHAQRGRASAPPHRATPADQ